MKRYNAKAILPDVSVKWNHLDCRQHSAASTPCWVNGTTSITAPKTEKRKSHQITSLFISTNNKCYHLRDFQKYAVSGRATSTVLNSASFKDRRTVNRAIYAFCIPTDIFLCLM